MPALGTGVYLKFIIEFYFINFLKKYSAPFFLNIPAWQGIQKGYLQMQIAFFVAKPTFADLVFLI